MNVKKMNKRISVIVCMILVMSIFAALPGAMAWNIPNTGDNADNGENANLVEINAVGGDVDPFYVGEQDVTFRIQLENIYVAVAPGIDDLERFEIQVASVDGPGTANAVSWDDSLDDSHFDLINNGNQQWSTDFVFDVADDNTVAAPGTYNITFAVTYDWDHDEDGTVDHEDTEQEYLEFDIEDNTEVHDGEPSLWAGEEFQQIHFQVDNGGGENLVDPSLTLDNFPDGVTLKSYIAVLEDIPNGNNVDAFYRADVDSDVEPGIYGVDYTFEATRAGVDIVEEGTVNFTVNFTAKVTCDIVGGNNITIEQGTIETTFDVEFTNVGNVDLIDLEVGLREKDPFFIKAVEYYEYNDKVTPDTYPMGDLAVDGTTDSVSFTIGFHRNLQDGMHKFEFYWNAWLFNDGSTGESSRYAHVGVHWVNAVHPDEGRYYLVDGNSTIEQPWIAPSAMMTVDDEHVDITGELVNLVDLSATNDLTYTTIELNLTNHELVGYKDIIVSLVVGSGTPFYNPEDHTATSVEMKPASPTDLGPNGATDTWEFDVDINRMYVRQVLTGDAHAFSGQVIINRIVNVDNNEEMTDMQVEMKGGLNGLGPRVAVEGTLENDKVKAGEMFNLTYTLSNHGDDVARDVWVTMTPDLYDNTQWTIHDNFITAIASDNETMSMWSMSESTNTEYSEVTLENLAINDAKEIVELHMYVEGALSSPQPHIWRMYVGELAPGEEIEVTWQMVSDRDMEIGKPYQEDIEVQYMDSNGVVTADVFTTTIRTHEKGETYEPSGSGFAGTSTDTGLIIVFIIIVIALLLIVMMTTKKGGKKEEEPETTIMEEPEPEPVMEEETVEEEPWGEEPEEESWGEPEEEPEEESWEEEPEEAEESEEEEVW